MQAKSIVSELKTETGKNVNNRIRQAGFIPAVIYSHGKSDAIKFNKKEFLGLFDGYISESVIFDLKINNKAQDAEMMAFVKDYQTHPVTGEIIHVDLYRVTKGEKIHTQVHVELVGTPKGIKLGGLLEVAERIIEIECLPGSLPDHINYDITEMLVGDVIHAKDITLPEGIKLLSNPDLVMVAVHLPKTVAEEKPAEAEVVAVPAAPAKSEKSEK